MKTPTTMPVIARDVQIVLPLTTAQAKAVVRAAPALGVEPWELGAYALSWRLDQWSRGGRVMSDLHKIKVQDRGPDE